MSAQMSVRPLLRSIFITLILASASHFSFAGTPLEDAQEKIIQLQNDKIELMQKLTKTYTSGGICYPYKDECLRAQAAMNRKLSIQSTDELSMSVSCKYEETKTGICQRNNYMLRTKVKISPE